MCWFQIIHFEYIKILTYIQLYVNFLSSGYLTGLNKLICWSQDNFKVIISHAYLLNFFQPIYQLSLSLLFFYSSVHVFPLYPIILYHIEIKTKIMDSSHSKSEEQTKTKARTSSDFIFCEDPNKLAGLIMLANHQSILQKIMQDVIEPSYFWIYPNNQAQMIMLSVCQQIQKRSLTFVSIESMMEFLYKSSNAYKKVILIIDTAMQTQAKVLLRKQKFIGVISLSINQSSPSKSISAITSEKHQYCQDDDTSSRYDFVNCASISQLNIFLQTNDWGLSQTKNFPNYVLLKQQVQKSSMLYCTMIAMINEKDDKGIKYKIINQLIAVFFKLAKLHPRLRCTQQSFKNAMDLLKQGQITDKQMIKVYTSQKNKIHIVLNTFLRALNCSTQIYYIQPIFKELYWAIKKLYQSEAKGRQFVCFRGGFLTGEEAEKLQEGVGEGVQNLGFLSTSLDRQSAYQFKQNIIYEIHVNQSLKSGDNIPGYAEISRFSEFVAEYQILFNPLNYFYLLEVKCIIYEPGDANKNDPEFHIVFRFGNLNCIKNTGNEQQDQNRKTTEMILCLLQWRNDPSYWQSQVLLSVVNDQQQYKIAKIYFEYLSCKCSKLSTKFSKIYPGSSVQSKENVWKRESMGLQDQYYYLAAVHKNCGMLIKFGDYQQALYCCQQSTPILRDLLTEKHPWYLRNLLKIGKIYKNLSKFEEAIELLLRLQHQIKQNLGVNNTIYVDNLSQISDNYSRIAKYAKALQFCQRSIDIAKDLYDQMHPAYLELEGRLGTILYWLGRYTEALNVHERCERIQKIIQGEKSPEYLNTLKRIAIDLYALCRYQEALQLIKRCGEIEKIVFGERHLVYITNMKIIGMILTKLGRLKEALKVLKECKQVIKDIWGEQNVNYLFTLFNIGNVLFLSQNCKQALAIYKQCQVKTKNLLGQRHSEYLKILDSLGCVYTKLKINKKALSFNTKSLNLKKQIFGQEHPEYLRTLFNISNTLMNLCQYEESLKCQLQCEKKVKLIYGEKNERYLQILVGIAINLDNKQKYREALEMSLKCVEDGKAIVGEQHSIYINVVSNTIAACTRLYKEKQAYQIAHNYAKGKKINHSCPFRFRFWKSFADISLRLGEYEQAFAIIFRIPHNLLVQSFIKYFQILCKIRGFHQASIIYKLCIRQSHSKISLLALKQDAITLLKQMVQHSIYEKMAQKWRQFRKPRKQQERKVKHSVIFLNF